MKNKGIIIGILVIALLAIGFWWWKGKEKKTQDKEVVKIGAILPLSGNVAFLGNAGKNGLEFAEYYFNKQDNSKYTYKFIFEDGQAHPTKSLSAYNKLIGSDKVKAIFSVISAVDLSLIPEQKKNKTIFFSHSSHPDLRNVDEYFFRHSNTVEQEADFILSKSNTSEKMLLIAMNDEYGIAFESYLSKKIEDRLTTIKYPKGENDFSTLGLKIKKSNSDYIVICGAGQNLNTLVSKIRELGDNRTIYTTIAYTASGADANSKEIKNLKLVQLENITANNDFSIALNEFENQKGVKLGTFDLIFFNSAYILLSSINKVGLSNENIINEISSHQKYNVLGGEISITKDNDILPRLVLKEQ